MIPSTWKEQRVVEAFEVDVTRRLRLSELFSFLLSIAWKHALASGFGFQELAERKMMWVLSKFQMAVSRLPEWGEQITIETWGKRIERFYALRDFLVSSPKGARLASATGAWMILDKDNYRPKKLEQLMAGFPWQEGNSALEGSLRRVAEGAKGQDRLRHRVVFSDLDMNNHVNAAKYLQWVMDSYSREVLESRQVETVEISFLAEATVDDEIAVQFAEIDGQEICTVRRIADQKELCRSTVAWRRREDG